MPTSGLHSDIAGTVPLRAVLAAIYFDHQRRFNAGEIGDVRRDGMLAPELRAEGGGAECSPQAAFGVGAVHPEITRTGMLACARHVE